MQKYIVLRPCKFTNLSIERGCPTDENCVLRPCKFTILSIEKS